MTIDEIRKGDWVVNQHGNVCKIKYIYKDDESEDSAKIADGVGWFGLVTVFLDKCRLATKDEVLRHKSSKEKPFNVNRDVKPL